MPFGETGGAGGGVQESDDPVAWAGNHSWTQSLLIPDGTVGAPGLAFASDPDSGIFLDSGQGVVCVFGGAQKFKSGLYGILVGSSSWGTQSAPQLMAQADQNTGLFWPSSDVLGITTGAVERARFSSAGAQFAVPILLADGSAGSPSLIIASNPGIGIYKAGAIMGFAAGGSAKMQIGSGGVRFGVGSAGAPGISATNDTDTGIYWPSVDQLGLTAGAAEVLRIDNTGATPQIQAAIDGTTTLPVYSFLSDPDSGMWKPASNQIAFSTNGIERLRIATNYISMVEPLRIPVGSAAAPAINWAADTGIYRIGANEIGFSCAGVERFGIGSTALTATVPFLALDGTQSLPAYSFLSDVDSGMWVNGTGLRFSFAGTERLEINANGIEVAGRVIANAQFQGYNGSLSGPTFRFTSYSTSGMWHDGTGLAFSHLGVEKLRLNSVGTIVTGALETSSYIDGGTGVRSGGNLAITNAGLFWAPNGAVGAPGFTFTNYQTSGIWHDATGMRFSHAGTERLSLTATDQQIGDFLFTADGGIARRKTNETGADSIKGTVVENDTTVAGGVIVAIGSSKNPCGIIYEDGVSDTDPVWVVFNGNAKVLQEDLNDSLTVPHVWAGTGTVPGRCVTAAVAPGAVAAHFGEVGHPNTRSVVGTDVLIDIEVQFL